ncbi:Uncharacterised protein [Vibrio cholerae]|nr:Uncharacterised protein [Vibrio cholerae]
MLQSVFAPPLESVPILCRPCGHIFSPKPIGLQSERQQRPLQSWISSTHKR